VLSINFFKVYSENQLSGIETLNFFVARVMTKADVIIVGGGLAGIACARSLHDRGVNFLLLEASDALGGRVRSDKVNGYVLDRGFQVFNSCYTETLDLLGRNAPRFFPFRAGALIKTERGMWPYCDPLREPGYILQTLLAPLGSIMDKFRMLALRIDASKSTPFKAQPIIKELQERKFSDRVIKKFFQPFLGGIFLDGSLQTSSLAFKQVFRSFALGQAQLPEGGMGEISRRLALPLPETQILLGRKVTAVKTGQVILDTGETFDAKQIVLALDVDALSALLSTERLPESRRVFCFYFQAKGLEKLDRFLVLNGTETGLINNLAVLSSVAPGYSTPKGQLLSVTVLARNNTAKCPDENLIRADLEAWFSAARFEFIAKYDVKGALPDQKSHLIQMPSLPGNVSLCGDLAAMRDYGVASIENVVRSGKVVGAAVADLLR
jgi:hypothetical protein